jgi:hypothetical protein
MSVFIFDRHGVQVLPSAHAIARTGPLIKVYVEKRDPRGEPAAIVRLADDTMVSLVNPAAELEHDPQSWPRHAGRAPGVYVRIDGVMHAFPAAVYRGVSFRLADDDSYVEVFTSDRAFISNHLDLDMDQNLGELLLAAFPLAPGVVVGDGSKGAIKPVGPETAQPRG